MNLWPFMTHMNVDLREVQKLANNNYYVSKNNAKLASTMRLVL